MRFTALGLLTAGILSCSTESAGRIRSDMGAIRFSSDDEALNAGFDWARRQALSYVFEGDPVGNWYEAALPGREAFCMRDVSHQATGALALGLAGHTKNMLHKFAVNIAESRDYCSYWEINRYDSPAPVDYRSDEDFWYNLPANFDVVHSCYRVYEWTGDRDFLDDPTFSDFYRSSLVDYVRAWDPNGDGLMESPAENGIRGIPTYWEGRGPRAVTGGDLIAAQYAAGKAYARMLSARNDSTEAQRFNDEAILLQRQYNGRWWSAELERFYTSIVAGGSFDTTHIPLLQILPLYFGIVEPGKRRETLLDDLAEGEIVEVNAYLPEVYYQSGRNEEGLRYLMRQLDPNLERREYPENPFTAIGTTVRYLMGIDPRATESLIETQSRLVPPLSWARVEHVPVFDNAISIRHDGTKATRFTNERGPTISWRAVFAGEHATLLVDGEPVPSTVRVTDRGEPESYVLVEVPPGSEKTVSNRG